MSFLFGTLFFDLFVFQEVDQSKVKISRTGKSITGSVLHCRVAFAGNSQMTIINHHDHDHDQ